MNKNEVLASFLLAIFLALAPFHSPKLSIFSQADSPETIAGSVEWSGIKEITTSMVIDANSELIINKGTIVEFKGGSLEVRGKLYIKGTVKDPVTIKASGAGIGYSILVSRTGVAYIRNADVSGGGSTVFPTLYNDKYFLNKALAFYSLQGAINVEEGTLNVQNSNFHDNVIAISAYNTLRSTIKVNRSKFSNSSYRDVSVNGYMGDNRPYDFQYNFWDDPNGPQRYCPTCGVYFNFSGSVNFLNYLVNWDFHDPLILIPGILGSQKKAGQWQMDLVLHTYDNLYAELVSEGYVPGQNLFEFPYEWRDSNVENAKLLKAKIQQIKTEKHWPKVDLVAHSMGGLLARQYIESSDYADDVDQLVTLGTPHLGSPEAYLKWDGDGWFWQPADIYAKHILGQEAEEAGEDDIFDYIHSRPVASLQELLPVYDYLREVENDNQYKTYWYGYPRNEFLEKLNSGAKKAKLKSVEFDKIIGNIERDAESTISGFKIVEADMGKLWEHGYPLGLSVPVGDRGLTYNNGDGTVPLFSAESESISDESVNIPADEKIVLDSDHRSLPTEAQKDVLELLTGKRPTNEVRNSLVKNIFIVSVFSPIDIQVIAPDGKKIGKNFLTGGSFEQIPGAFYSGYDTENEFVTIPNPVDGEYRILTQGTGAGEYKIKATKIFETTDEQIQASEATAEITGTATVNAQEELAVTVSETAVEDASRDNIPPTISGAATSQPNVNGWHNQAVTIHFEATDESGIAEITPDALLAEEGENQSVSGSATDTAGNTASMTVSGINIDKTAPVTSAQIVGTKGQNDYYTGAVELKLVAGDNLSQIEKTFFSLDGASYQIGTDFLIETGGEHVVKYYSTDKAGNSEAEKTLSLKIDNTAPVAEIIVPQNKTYKNNQILTLKYTLTDETSPTDRIKTEVALDDRTISASKIDLALEHLGAHALSITAQDEAGNRSAKTEVSFESKTDISALLSNIDHYFNLKLITARATKYQLEIKLKIIQEKMKLLAIFQSKWMPKFAKDRVVENLKKDINREIENLISAVQDKKKFSGTINQKAKELLLESLQFVKL